MYPFFPWQHNEQEKKKKQEQIPLYQELPLPIHHPIDEKEKTEEQKDNQEIIIIELF